MTTIPILIFYYIHSAYLLLIHNSLGNYAEVDMIGGLFHLWFGAFIGKQTMKTRAVSK